MLKIIVMSSLIICFFQTASISFASDLDEPVKVKRGGKLVPVYGSWIYTCYFKGENVEYLYHSNQAGTVCGLTYKYYKCIPGPLVSGSCSGNSKWVDITKKKLIYSSTIETKLCRQRAKKLSNKLIKLGFSCSESGYN